MIHHGENLIDVDPRLIAVVSALFMDVGVVTGFRGAQAQMEAYEAGYSKVKWPNSKHNQKPALAVDVAPYPVDWNQRERFYVLAGAVLQEAKRRGITLRWGGDFNQDGNLTNDRFLDLAHFEIVEPESKEA